MLTERKKVNKMELVQQEELLTEMWLFKGMEEVGQLIRRNAEQVAAQWGRQAARLEAQVEQMFDGLDDADGAEDVPFDELVGMQGPVFHLVENAFTVLASNMIFLGVVVFVPFSLGGIILHYLSWLFTSAAGLVLSSDHLITTGEKETTGARNLVVYCHEENQPLSESDVLTKVINSVHQAGLKYTVLYVSYPY